MRKKALTYYLEVLLKFFEITFVCSAVILSTYLLLGQILEVSGDSMTPLIKNGQHLLAEKVSLKTIPLKRGEIVVFSQLENGRILLIKRIAGLPNENIKLEAGQIYINNNALDETYLQKNTYTAEGSLIKEGFEYVIPDSEYFVLGDNRVQSIDSREYGFVSKDLMLGRAVFIYEPLKDFKILLGR